MYTHKTFDSYYSLLEFLNDNKIDPSDIVAITETSGGWRKCLIYTIKETQNESN